MACASCVFQAFLSCTSWYKTPQETCDNTDAENRGVECDPEAQKCRKVEKQRGRKVKSMKSKEMSEEGTGINQILMWSL